MTTETQRAQDVFISYRRDGGEHLAGRVKDALKNRGFSVFMDVEDLKSGLFDEALFGKISAATDFVVILTPGCLDRCKNEDDWLRQEIRFAMKSDKNIVPVIARGFQMPLATTLPSDISDLVRYNGLTPAHELFEASVDRLVSIFLKSKAQRYPGPPYAPKSNVSPLEAEAQEVEPPESTSLESIIHNPLLDLILVSAYDGEQYGNKASFDLGRPLREVVPLVEQTFVLVGAKRLALRACLANLLPM